MRPFELIHANSYEEAAELLKTAPASKVDVMAGGTDLLNTYKQKILKEHPDQVINLKNIPDSAGISSENGTTTIKANTKLTAIAESEELPNSVKQAAYSVATPLIRNIATIGGNICQDVRCWYYRYPHEAGGRVNCARKGGETCYAIRGENRYHSIFGGMKAGANECSRSCPAGTDISAYMDKIRKGDWDSAAKIILKANPMPMLTSRICPHPCQDNCNQTHYGECVNIHCVERTLGDYILANKEKFYLAPEASTGKTAVVIGAGPGGLSAAYYLRRQGHEVTVLDRNEKAGGVLQYGIPNYRLPVKYVDQFVDALKGMGIVFKMNTEVGKDVAMDDLLASYDTVYVGTGAWKQPILGIRGEELTQFGLDFLVQVNTYLKKSIDETVLVCGGGNVAMDVALTAKRLGAKHVILACLEQRNEMPATEEEIARAIEEGVEIQNGWGLKSVETDEAGNVIGLNAMRCTSVRDAEGRFAPTYEEENVRLIQADTILLATGQKVDLSFLGEKLAGQIESPRGLLDADTESGATKNEKIYGGGDVLTGPNIAIRAIAAGRVAANNMSVKMGTVPVAADKETGFLTFDPEGIKEKVGAKLTERTVEERNLVDEDSMSLSMAEAEKEAGRCMNCGCYSVNASDISPVLLSLDGTIVTTKKEIPAERFFTTELNVQDMLDQDELVTAVKFGDFSDYVTGYIKARIRPAIDFAIESIAYAYKAENGVITDIRLVAGGVAPVPVRLTEVETYLKGKTVTEEIAEEAGKLAVQHAAAMDKNAYKVNGLQTMVSRLIAEIK